MSHITIVFDTDNAAFEYPDEITMILEQAASKINRLCNESHASLYDSNGNKVGSISITEFSE